MKKLVLIPYHKYQYFQSLQQTGEKKDLEKPQENTELNKEELRETNIPREKLDEDIILCHISKGKRTKAKALIQYIEQSPDLDWNLKGELLVKGKTITGSHISDLVKDSVTEYKHFEPLGVQEFYQHIGNIPLTIISNPKRRQSLQTGGQSIPPGEPEKTKTRVLKIFETTKKSSKKSTKKPVKRLKSSWKEMWKTI